MPQLAGGRSTWILSFTTRRANLPVGLQLTHTVPHKITKLEPCTHRSIMFEDHRSNMRAVFVKELSLSPSCVSTIAPSVAVTTTRRMCRSSTARWGSCLGRSRSILTPAATNAPVNDGVSEYASAIRRARRGARSSGESGVAGMFKSLQRCACPNKAREASFARTPPRNCRHHPPATLVGRADPSGRISLPVLRSKPAIID